MKVKINLTPDQIDLFKKHGSTYIGNEDSTYYNLPFWFKETGTEWEIVTSDDYNYNKLPYNPFKKEVKIYKAQLENICSILDRSEYSWCVNGEIFTLKVQEHE